MGRLEIDGEVITSPDFFQTQLYECRNIANINPRLRPDSARYVDHGIFSDLMKARIPDDGIYVFGDNTVSSNDSRYWGAVGLNRLRGRAIFRYWWPPTFLR